MGVGGEEDSEYVAVVRVQEGLGVGDRAGVRETVRVGEGMAVDVGDPVAEGVGLRILLKDGEADTVEREVVRVSEADGEGEGVRVKEREKVDWVRVKDRVRDLVGVGTAVRVCVGVRELGAVRVDTVAEGVAGDAEGLPVHVRVETERETEAEQVLAVKLWLRLSERVSVGLMRTVWLQLLLPDAEGVVVGASVGVRLWVVVGVPEGTVAVMEKLGEAVRDPGLGVTAAVRDVEAEALEAVGVLERVVVRVDVGRLVRVGVNVDGVREAVPVTVDGESEREPEREGVPEPVGAEGLRGCVGEGEREAEGTDAEGLALGVPLRDDVRVALSEEAVMVWEWDAEGDAVLKAEREAVGEGERDPVGLAECDGLGAQDPLKVALGLQLRVEHEAVNGAVTVGVTECVGVWLPLSLRGGVQVQEAETDQGDGVRVAVVPVIDMVKVRVVVPLTVQVERLRDGLELRVVVVEGVRVPMGVRENVGVGVRGAVGGVWLVDGLVDRVESEAENEQLLEGLTERLVVREGEAETQVEAEGEAEAEAVSEEAVVLWERVSVRLRDAVALWEGLQLCVPVHDCVRDGLTAAEGDRLPVGVRLWLVVAVDSVRLVEQERLTVGVWEAEGGLRV